MDNGASSYRRFLDGDDKGLEEIVRDYAEKCGKYNINLANESEAITNLCYQ